MDQVRDLRLSRRAALGAFGAAATLPLAGAAEAAAPITGIRAPDWYRFRIGEFEATVIQDGPLALGEPSGGFPQHPKEDLANLLQQSFLPTNALTLDQNCLLLNTGRQLILFDNGVGFTRPFGPNTGLLLANLRAAGVHPDQVDALVISHAHIDHCWGIIGGDGKPNFPNARVFISKADFDYWTAEDRQNAQGFVGDFVKGARRNLLPVRERITFVEDGKEVVPGVTAVSAPGHTVGHMVYAIQSGNSKAMFIGDLAHHQVIMLRRPQIEFAFDTDARQSAQSRLRILRQLAQERMALVAYHFPFPGLGHVAAEGEGFGWYPAAWGADI
ncbi:MBL fold metallo-hydrolase [Elioraea rosea]|uniref:MBL fold metallo-hydrolase n=1 Tax=Elioraea rosea TaxID=2492390 RepID=UPI00118201F5|nr:MBL fold metallo-hydrolase [Elioraea rosea]